MREKIAHIREHGPTKAMLDERARELEILTDGRAVTGAELETMTDVELEREVERLTAEYAAASEIPCPPEWGGFRVVPDALEFWQGRPNRLHDRLRYAVLVVNQFYRAKKAPIAEAGAATPIQDLRPLAQGLNETTQMTDAKAFIGWLDQQSSVAKNRKIGTQGYCMGGPMALRTAAAAPDRVGAVASFHGGGLVTDMPNSPHLQAAKTRAQFLIAIAETDDMRSPNDKNVLKEAFARVNLPAEIEVYPAAHGWCPPDTRVYNQAQSEKAWSRLLALYGKALAST